MNKINGQADWSAGRPRMRPRIVLSPVARKVQTIEDIRFGIQAHAALDYLPFSFRGRRDRKFMISTTENRAVTFMMMEEEFPDFTKKYKMRELSEEIVNA